MKSSQLLFLLATTAIGSNTLATSEALPVEETMERALMNEADVQKLNAIKHQLNPYVTYEAALITLINTCDNENSEEHLISKNFIQDTTNKLSATELKEILTRNINAATEKAKTAQCKNCDLLLQEMNYGISQCSQYIIMAEQMIMTEQMELKIALRWLKDNNLLNKVIADAIKEELGLVKDNN